MRKSILTTVKSFIALGVAVTDWTCDAALLISCAMIAVEFLLISFVVHFHNGYGFSSPGGGWEYPFMWGVIIFAISLRGGGPYSLHRAIGKEV